MSYIISLCSKGGSCCYSECRIGMMLYIWLYPWIWCITASVQCMMIQLYTNPRSRKFGRIYINNTSDWSRTITIPLPNRNYCSDEASVWTVVSIGQGYSYCPWPIRGIVYIYSSEFPISWLRIELYRHTTVLELLYIRLRDIIEYTGTMSYRCDILSDKGIFFGHNMYFLALESASFRLCFEWVTATLWGWLCESRCWSVLVS